MGYIGGARIVIGSMSLPFAIDNDVDRKWLEEWIFRSAEGILGLRTVELFFSYKKDIDASYKFLTKSNIWQVVDGMTFLAPNGMLVEFNYNPETERSLVEYKKQYKK